MAYYLVIDLGTTSARAVLYAADFECVDFEQRPLHTSYPYNGWVEQSPEQILEAVLLCLVTLVHRHPSLDEQSVSLSITNQRETTVLWDRASGQSIYPAIVWQDRRTHDVCQSLNQHEAMLTKKTGLLLDPYFSATKIRWILDHVPSARQKAMDGSILFGTLDSFLLWHLSSTHRHATDATNASRTMLFDIHAQRWDPELLSLFGIPAVLLPTVCDTADDYGETDRSLFGLQVPIRVLVGDQQASAVGHGVVIAGRAKATYGTGCFVLMHTGQTPIASSHRMLTTVALRMRGEVTYALEGSIFVAGAAIQWLRDNMGVIADVADSESLAASVPDTNGVYMVPAFTGLGAPYWDPDSRGAILGLTRDCQVAHLVRAALEAVCFQTYDLMTAMQSDAQVTPDVLYVDGGMVENTWLLQCLSDILSCDVDRAASAETTALGAAMLAAVGAGHFPSLASVSQYRTSAGLYQPEISEEHQVQRVAGWRAAVTRVLSSSSLD